MTVTDETCTKWEIQIPDKVTDVLETKRTTRIVPAPFCATKYMIVARYLVGIKRQVKKED